MSATEQTVSPINGAADLAEDIKEQILSGHLSPGDRLPTFVELEKNTGLASSTINRAYDRLQKEDLVHRVRGSGVYVAESENIANAQVIGCWGGCFEGGTAYWMKCINGIRNGANDNDVDVMLMPDMPTRGSWKKIDGVVTSPPMHDGLPDPLQGKPRVSMMFDHPTETSVVADEYGGGRKATMRLLELGHRRIASMYFTSDNPYGERRHAGYHDALRGAGIDPPPEFHRECVYRGELEGFTNVARKRMQEWLESGWRDLDVTAILAHNDEIAVGIMQALQQAGLSVPGDVSVIGFDGSDVSTMCYPALTTVKVPLRTIGRRSVSALLQKMEETDRDGPREKIVLDVELVERGTTAPPSR